MKSSEVMLYQGTDGSPAPRVLLEEDTVWLTQGQMALLFDRERAGITQHIRNIFKEGELEVILIRKDFLLTALDGKSYLTMPYNLDVIISVGYRVKSIQGTQFRRWATKALKDYAIKGYALNEQCLAGRLEEASRYLELLITPLKTSQLSAQEQQGFVELIERYAKTMALLSRFDEGRLESDGVKEPVHILDRVDCLEMVALLKVDLIGKGRASELFGNQKDVSFSGVSGAVNQTVFGEEA